MKKVLILIIGLFLILQSYSQEKTDAMLFGDVKSAISKEHIPYVTIVVKGTRMGTTSDGTGYLKLFFEQ
jgi:outer membrane receptor for ferrienterochelin and colicins